MTSMVAGIAAGAAASAVAAAASSAMSAGMAAATSGGMNWSSLLVPASIICHQGLNAIVPFSFNPEKIQVTRTASGDTKPSAGTTLPTGSAGTVVWKVEPTKITLNDVILEGLLTKWYCDTLMNWMSPPGGAEANLFLGSLSDAGTPTQALPPKLTFNWGPPMVGFWYDVNLTSCTVTFERFMPIGIPVRARVSLVMTQIPNSISSLPTNPTSGGEPGRRRHIVTAGDTLASIAHTYYGSPQAWRRIADVNRLADPSRLRPGSAVYLPNPGELVQAGS